MGRKSTIRLGKALLAAIALTAGAAGLGARGAESDPAGQAAADSGAAAAAPQGAPQSSGITLRVTSRETVVDVTVTDAKGQPIHTLRQSDFTLKEDGRPQALESFQEYKEADTPPAERIPPKLPPNVYNNLQPAPTADAVNILLLDALNTLPSDQVFMKQESIKYLKSMPRGTRIAVLASINTRTAAKVAASEGTFQQKKGGDLPGEIFLRVGILDAVADKVGTLEIPLKASKNPAGTTGQPGGKSVN